MAGHDHDHDHGHDHHHHPGAFGFLSNLGAGQHAPVGRFVRVFANLARRGRGGRPHVCCGNYGEPGC